MQRQGGMRPNMQRRPPQMGYRQLPDGRQNRPQGNFVQRNPGA